MQFIKLTIVLLLAIFGNAIGCAEAKTLVMGTSADYPPFEFMKDGEIIGFDIELAQMIASELGYSLVIKDMDFTSLIPSLESGKIDFSMAGFTPTEERKRVVDFSSEYYTGNAALLSVSARYQDVKQLYGKVIGVQLGSVWETIARSVLGNDTTIHAINRVPLLVEELKIGQIDAILLDSNQARAFADNIPQLGYKEINTIDGGWSVAFPKGSALKQEFNQIITKLRANGEIDKLAARWSSIKLDAPKNAFGRIETLLPSFIYILQGALITLQYSIISVSFGLALSIILVLCKISHNRILQNFANFYTSIFRGTPLIVQISIFYLGVPSLLDINISAFTAGIMTFSLNSAAYLSEILRAGVNSIDKGQYEAAESLGVSRMDILRDIIFPQALRRSLPAIVNEIVDLIKESSLISIIGEADIMRRAQLISAEKYTYFEPFLVAAGCYYVLVLAFTKLAKTLERRISYKAK